MIENDESDPNKGLRDRLIFAREDQQKENDRFYIRSAFFWGFIAAGFVAYAASVRYDSVYISTVISCFGLISSVFWSLINRGSTHWQGVFVDRVQRIEEKLYGQREYLTGEISYFDRSAPWLRSRSFSMTKLTIAFSDFTVCTWVTLVLRSIVNVFVSPSSKTHNFLQPTAVFLIIILSLCFVYAAARAAHRPR